MRRTWSLAVVLLFIPVPTLAAQLEASEPVRVPALAVAQTPDGLVGIVGHVEAQAIAHGSGRVFLDTKPLAETDMQGSARQAARVAASMLGLDWQDYDYLIVFRSGSPVIGGPSAGAVMTTSLMVALHNLASPNDPWTLDPGVAATGTINPDGTVGPVGGVPAKAQGAAEAGLRHVLYPAGLDQVRQGSTVVEMADVCAGLKITCTPAATVLDIVEAAAGVRIERPDVSVPGTADYGPQLRERVLPEIDRLAERIEALDPALAGDDLAAVQADIDAASDRLDRARQAYADARYYTAATESFQGAIRIGTAEHRAAFYASGRDVGPVEDALEACAEDADDAAELADGLTANGRTGLYAVGAAQRRATEAQTLAQRAAAEAQAATRREELVQALFTASFCTERADTVSWWAGLEDAFGDGPPVDMDELVDATLTETRAFVEYADAVLSGGAIEARRLLAEAQAHAEAGQRAAALIASVEAQTAASVAMQVTSGNIDDAVLAAAQDAASRAIVAARAAGVEPVLSVSLVELSADREDDALALQDLWAARSLALLAGATGPAPDSTRLATHWQEAEVGTFIVGAVLGAGFIALLFAVALFVTAMLPRRRA